MNNSKYIFTLSLVLSTAMCGFLQAQQCIKHVIFKNNGQIDTLSVYKIDYDTLTPSFVDSRDSQSYKLLTIGNQIWMAENLRYDIPGVDGFQDTFFVNSNTKYGRIYDWYTVMANDSLNPSSTNPSGIQGICPNGFHLPSRSEWFELEIAMGLNPNDTLITGFRGTHADSMKSTSGWASNMNGSNSSGFNSYPAGAGFLNYLQWEGKRAGYWTATEDTTPDKAFLVSNDTFNQGVENYWGDKLISISCRCVKNNNTLSTSITADYYTTGGAVYHYHMANIDSVKIIPACSCPDSVTDSRDNQTYAVVQIGDDCWMAENLRYDVPGVFGASDTLNNSYPSNYGRLYDWSTFMNGSNSSSTNPSGVQGVCPSGWHVPSDAEWNSMEMALGMPPIDTSVFGYRGVHGYAMKSISGWTNNGNGSNNSGFNAFPSSNYNSGSFQTAGNLAFFWTSTEDSVSNALSRHLFYGNNSLKRSIYTKTYGFSCRCVKD